MGHDAHEAVIENYTNTHIHTLLEQKTLGFRQICEGIINLNHVRMMGFKIRICQRNAPTSKTKEIFTNCEI